MEVLQGMPRGAAGERQVVTVGTFDGVHLGHRALLSRGRQRANELDVPYTVVTFDPPPRTVLFPAAAPDLLNSLEEKLGRLSAAGVDRTAVVEFTREFAQKEAADFMAELDGAFRVAELVLGHDHGLGRGRGGDVDFLKEWGKAHGYSIEVLSAVSVGGEVISSSAIRSALLSCELERANRMLGYPYQLAGRVERGHGVGRSLGFPTANLNPPPGKLVPGEGVYLVAFSVLSSSGHGLMDIGRRPTFGDFRLSVEAYLLDWDRDIYNQSLSVELLRYLRPDAAFPTVEDLVKQMHEDVARARSLIAVGAQSLEAAS
jgi:riboflavin kinase/FMN adenylyltransferase